MIQVVIKNKEGMSNHDVHFIIQPNNTFAIAQGSDLIAFTSVVDLTILRDVLTEHIENSKHINNSQERI